MFADTITVTVNAVAKVLTRINQDKYSSEYLLKGTLEEFRLRIRNSNFVDKTRGVTFDRHNAELIHTIYPVAPSTKSTVRKTYWVLENESTDVVVDNAKFSVGFTGFLTEANVTKMLNFES